MHIITLRIVYKEYYLVRTLEKQFHIECMIWFPGDGQGD